MRKFAAILAGVVSASTLVVGSASAASANASCNGVLVSSLAGQPGVVAELTRGFHDEFKEAGLSPGLFDAAGAHEHSGGVEECLAALDG